MRIHGRAAGGGTDPLHGKNERHHAQNEDADEEERVGEGERRGCRTSSRYIIPSDVRRMSS